MCFFQPILLLLDLFRNSKKKHFQRIVIRALPTWTTSQHPQTPPMTNQATSNETLPTSMEWKKRRAFAVTSSHIDLPTFLHYLAPLPFFHQTVNPPSTTSIAKTRSVFIRTIWTTILPFINLLQKWPTWPSFLLAPDTTTSLSFSIIFIALPIVITTSTMSLRFVVTLKNNLLKKTSFGVLFNVKKQNFAKEISIGFIVLFNYVKVFNSMPLKFQI